MTVAAAIQHQVRDRETRSNVGKCWCGAIAHSRNRPDFIQSVVRRKHVVNCCGFASPRAPQNRAITGDSEFSEAVKKEVGGIAPAFRAKYARARGSFPALSGREYADTIKKGAYLSMPLFLTRPRSAFVSRPIRRLLPRYPLNRFALFCSRYDDFFFGGAPGVPRRYRASRTEIRSWPTN